MDNPRYIPLHRIGIWAQQGTSSSDVNVDHADVAADADVAVDVGVHLDK